MYFFTNQIPGCTFASITYSVTAAQKIGIVQRCDFSKETLKRKIGHRINSRKCQHMPKHWHTTSTNRISRARLWDV